MQHDNKSEEAPRSPRRLLFTVAGVLLLAAAALLLAWPLISGRVQQDEPTQTNRLDLEDDTWLAPAAMAIALELLEVPADGDALRELEAEIREMRPDGGPFPLEPLQGFAQRAGLRTLIVDASAEQLARYRGVAIVQERVIQPDEREIPNIAVVAGPAPEGKVHHLHANPGIGRGPTHVESLARKLNGRSLLISTREIAWPPPGPDEVIQ